jgi:hypothetical protein
MKQLLRPALVPLAVLLASAAPAPTMIPHPQYPNHVLVIPRDSPVKFKGWEDGEAVFKGQFLLTGGWSYGCAFGCSDPPVEADFQFELVPEKEIAARLPHWTRAGEPRDDGFGDYSIIITREAKLVATIVEPMLRTALREEKVPYIQGRTSILVDDFRTGLSCDNSYFSARFVAMAKAPKLAKAQPAGVGTCA